MSKIRWYALPIFIAFLVGVIAFRIWAWNQGIPVRIGLVAGTILVIFAEVRLALRRLSPGGDPVTFGLKRD